MRRFIGIVPLQRLVPRCQNVPHAASPKPTLTSIRPIRAPGPPGQRPMTRARASHSTVDSGCGEKYGVRLATLWRRYSRRACGGTKAAHAHAGTGQLGRKMPVDGRRERRLTTADARRPPRQLILKECRLYERGSQRDESRTSPRTRRTWPACRIVQAWGRRAAAVRASPQNGSLPTPAPCTTIAFTSAGLSRV
jgi:hypothetical protein